MADKREARKRKIAMSAEERLAKITGLYKSTEDEKPKIQFASENSDPRVEEIETCFEPVAKIIPETSSLGEAFPLNPMEHSEYSESMEESTIKLSEFRISNEFSLRLLATFLLGIYSVYIANSNQDLKFIGNMFTAFQVLGSIQEFYSHQKYIYNDYLKMVGLGNQKIDLLIRIYDGICNDLYMFVFTFGITSTISTLLVQENV